MQTLGDILDQAVISQHAVALMQALQQDRKIEAIKAFRNLTGHGLKESKDQIEATMEGIRATSSPSQGSYVVIDQNHDHVIHRNYWDAADQARRLVTGRSTQLIARVHSQVRANIVEEPYGQ